MNIPIDATADLPRETSLIPCAANFSDALGGLGHRFQAMSHKMRAVCPSFKIAGAIAYPVRCYAGATWALEQAIEAAPEGSVLVVDGGGYREAVLMGGLMSARARMRGLGGVVIDGAVRDIEEIRKAGWPIFAAATTPRAGTHDQQGEWNVPVSCGGVIVEPGDRIVADEDGVVVIPGKLWGEALAAARTVHAKEQFLEACLAAGDSLSEAVIKWKAR